MNICDDFVVGFVSGNFEGWKAEREFIISSFYELLFNFIYFSVVSTFSNFKYEENYGNFHDFGNFDKCINYESSDGNFKGKYCSVQYFPASKNVIPVGPKEFFCTSYFKNCDTRFHGAICIPSICDSNSIVTRIMEIVFNKTDFVLSTDYIQEDMCQLKHNFNVTLSGFFGM